MLAVFLVFAAIMSASSAFQINSRVRYSFSRVSAKAPESASDGEKKKGGLTLAKLVQLIGMGAGAPMLGEFKGVDERGALQFELEANNYNKECNVPSFYHPHFSRFADLPCSNH